MAALPPGRSAAVSLTRLLITPVQADYRVIRAPDCREVLIEREALELFVETASPEEIQMRLHKE
jgi:hypothetical protein